ncbi:MAG: dihydrofolate reductase [Verrucomicrobia bacterium]|nr:dihydrofolate reductase [Verrucomicrobiota bacterium]
MKFFKAIAAMSENRVIGQGNRIPWHLPEDFEWFKRMTIGQIVVMGRKTFESIGRPLPKRDTIVVTRTVLNISGTKTVNDLDRVDPASDPREFFICGGAQIYSQALSRCSDLYLTLVKRTVEGDTFFPRFEDHFEPAEIILEHDDFLIRRFTNRDLNAVDSNGTSSSHAVFP